MSDLFKYLGNTGMAALSRREFFLPDSHKTPEIIEIHNERKLVELFKLRHPDPSIIAARQLVDPGLQVLGSWRRLFIKNNGVMKSRFGSCSFIFESKSLS
jgi:hypothetical protein